METKHAPGPWVIHESGLVLALGPGGDVRTSESVAYAGHDRAQIFHKQNQTGMANARLIAAAPDMLEALESAMADGFLCGEVVEKVAAAIAKAKGGAA
jgi:hypothetical protein